MLIEILGAHRARRGQRGGALGRHLVLDDGKTTIHLLGGLGEGDISTHDSTAHEEGAAGLIGSRRFLGNGTYSGLRVTIVKRPKVAFLQAVTTGYATRVVHLVGLEVDARSLTVLGTQAARLALVSIKIDF